MDWLWLLLGVVWYASGFGSFIFWWSKDWGTPVDEEWLVALAAGILGPVSFLYGWIFHGDH